jgi:hypothetical protein
MQAQHASDYRASMTNWDELLDRQLTISERETLQSRNQESQQTKQLKKKFIQEKGLMKSRFETAMEGLKTDLENARSTLQKTKESLKGKLEQERLSLDQMVHECREWVGLKTGDLKLQSLEGKLSDEATKDLATIQDLKQVSARFETAKGNMLREMNRLRAHPMVRLVGSVWFLCIGFVLGAVAAAVAWSLAAVPLIMGLVGLVAAVVCVALLHFSTAPLVAKTIRRLFPAVVEQEQLENTTSRIVVSHFWTNSQCQILLTVF